MGVEPLIRLSYVSMVIHVVLLAVNDSRRELDILLAERSRPIGTELRPSLLCPSRLPSYLTHRGLVIPALVGLGSCQIRSSAQVGVEPALGAVLWHCLVDGGSLAIKSLGELQGANRPSMPRAQLWMEPRALARRYRIIEQRVLDH